MRALVIDDSSAMRRLIGRILSDLGFEVSEAENGSVGLAQLEQTPHPVDVALVDWNMPVMNGFEFVQAVRARPEHDKLRLMMVTTETGLVQIEQALNAGADEYVMKPFTRMELVSKLGLLGLRRSS
ncbi:MAG: response regulator [Myxococcota bacterium]